MVFPNTFFRLQQTTHCQMPPRVGPNLGNHAETVYCLSKSKVPPSTNRNASSKHVAKMTPPAPRKLAKLRRSSKERDLRKDTQTNLECHEKNDQPWSQKIMLFPSGLVLFAALFPIGPKGVGPGPRPGGALLGHEP